MPSSSKKGKKGKKGRKGTLPAAPPAAADESNGADVAKLSSAAGGADDGVDKLRPGMRCFLVGLISQTRLNGSIVILGEWHDDAGRFDAYIDDEGRSERGVRVRPTNIVPFDTGSILPCVVTDTEMYRDSHKECHVNGRMGLLYSARTQAGVPTISAVFDAWRSTTSSLLHMVSNIVSNTSGREAHSAFAESMAELGLPLKTCDNDGPACYPYATVSATELSNDQMLAYVRDPRVRQLIQQVIDAADKQLWQLVERVLEMWWWGGKGVSSVTDSLFADTPGVFQASCESYVAGAMTAANLYCLLMQYGCPRGDDLLIVPSEHDIAHDRLPPMRLLTDRSVITLAACLEEQQATPLEMLHKEPTFKGGYGQSNIPQAIVKLLDIRQCDTHTSEDSAEDSPWHVGSGKVRITTFIPPGSGEYVHEHVGVCANTMVSISTGTQPHTDGFYVRVGSDGDSPSHRHIASLTDLALSEASDSRTVELGGGGAHCFELRDGDGKRMFCDSLFDIATTEEPGEFFVVGNRDRHPTQRGDHVMALYTPGSGARPTRIWTLGGLADLDFDGGFQFNRVTSGSNETADHALLYFKNFPEHRHVIRQGAACVLDRRVRSQTPAVTLRWRAGGVEYASMHGQRIFLGTNDGHVYGYDMRVCGGRMPLFSFDVGLGGPWQWRDGELEHSSELFDRAHACTFDGTTAYHMSDQGLCATEMWRDDGRFAMPPPGPEQLAHGDMQNGGPHALADFQRFDVDRTNQCQAPWSNGHTGTYQGTWMVSDENKLAVLGRCEGSVALYEKTKCAHLGTVRLFDQNPIARKTLVAQGNAGLGASGQRVLAASTKPMSDPYAAHSGLPCSAKELREIRMAHTTC
jgi:hypothetical protein